MIESIENGKPLRVLIADDSESMRNAVISLLATEFEIVGQVDNGLEFVRADLELQPQIGIVDISMPILNGIDAVRKIRSRGSKMLVIYLTVHDDLDYVNAAFESGASGYVIKSRMATDLRKAIREVCCGRTFVSTLVCN